MLSRPWFLPATVFVVCWTLTTHGKYSVSGDEPHYLIVSHSLWIDGDLDLRNNHAQGDGRTFGSDGLQPGPHVRETPRGTLFPVHDIGLPVALVPIYAFATACSRIPPEHVLQRFRMSRGLFAYSLISLFLVALTAWAATLTRGGIVVHGTPAAIATGVVLALWVSPPVLSNAFLVFPEVFALLATAWVVHVAATRGPGRREVFATALLLGALPWFHRKYALYSLALACVLIVLHRASLRDLKPRARMVAVLLLAGPVLALIAWTVYHWGNIGGPLMVERAPFSSRAFVAGSLGSLVDRENGLFVWAPLYLFLAAAWALTWRRHALWLAPAAAIFVPAAAHDQWWGGFSPAARFMVPLTPIVALVTTDAWRVAGFRRFFLVLLVPQILISAYGWQNPRALWPRGDGNNRALTGLLGVVGGTDTFLPSVRAELDVLGGAMAAAVVLVANLAVWLVLRQRATDSSAAARAR